MCQNTNALTKSVDEWEKKKKDDSPRLQGQSGFDFYCFYCFIVFVIVRKRDEQGIS